MEQTKSSTSLDKDIRTFLIKHQSHYFEREYHTLDLNGVSSPEEIARDDLNKVIGLEIIDARRDVANTDGAAGQTLSKLSAKYYRTQDKSGPRDRDSVLNLQIQLEKTDDDLTATYKTFFEPVTDSIETFASTPQNETELVIQSMLRESSLFEQNTYVTYQHGDYYLPESYSGLGYMNLFAIIFHIHIKVNRLKRETSDSEQPAAINLLCIEEPEAHTHPQMEYIFIRNIKKLLQDIGEDLNLQTIMTTHSSHILSQCEFNDVRYFYRANKNEANLKSMQALQKSYKDHPEWFDFVKRFLTLNKSELFFADRVIFIEGPTERILLPVMMQMVDAENQSNPEYTPLLSQNISIVEVGTHAHKFANFLRFLEVKTLIITDIDSKNSSGKCRPLNGGATTTNASIRHFLNINSVPDLLNLSHEDKILRQNDDDTYAPDKDGKICIAYQTQDATTGYCGRTFEDAFLGCKENLQFVCKHKDDFLSLKRKDDLDPGETDYFKVADDHIDRKSSFAADVYYHTNSDHDNWTVPDYIREGLRWLTM